MPLSGPGRESGNEDTSDLKPTIVSKLSYQYGPLRFPDEIRLLVLAPGTSSDSFNCKLVQTRLSLNPDYEALSYAWGDSSKPRQVICDNLTVDVTQSLYSALRHLRDPTKSRTIWADAICINQFSNTEKNHQVKLMNKIYSQAERTLAYIGEGEDHIVDSALDFLERLDKYLCDNLEGYDTKTLGLDIIDVPQQLLKTLSTSWIPEFYRCLGPLFAYPWFQRLWIVQEVVLAKAVEVVFGTRTLPFDKMLNPILIIAGFVVLENKPHDFNVSGLTNLFDMGVVRVLHGQGLHDDPKQIPSQILEVLGRLHLFAATDTRDKIYALLGLGYAPGFVADYNLSINDVFQSFAIWCLESKSDGFENLSYAGLPQNVSGLASWVPTFHASGLGSHLIEIDHFHACGLVLSSSDSPKLEETWRLSSGSALDLRSGRIDDVGTVVKLRLQPRLKETLPVLKEIFDAAKCNQHTLANERYHNLCRAMTAELDRFGVAASPEQMEKSHRQFQILLDNSYTQEEFQSAEIDLNDTFQVFQSYLVGKNFCLTSHDRFAWIPEFSEVGDKIFVFQGAAIPFVVRPMRDGKYTLVGECWIQGLMEGEALSLPSFSWEYISLI